MAITTLQFRPGNVQATVLYDEQRKRNLVSSNGTVRIVEMSATNDRFIELKIVALPRADDGVFAGYDSLRTFLLTTVNWAQEVWTYNDNDGDSFEVRVWPHTFDFSESKKDEFSGTLLLRVEV